MDYNLRLQILDLRENILWAKDEIKSLTNQIAEAEAEYRKTENTIASDIEMRWALDDDLSQIRYSIESMCDERDEVEQKLEKWECELKDLKGKI